MDHNKSPLNNKEKRHLLKRKCYQVEVEETTREGEGKTATERKDGSSDSLSSESMKQVAVEN
ncbi:hypothetical protein NC651_008426 [Populus alba x Populus x berolinensis]|nr:hypothetical protein NC651_008426 [Populus alba x Populus x berolinensis]